MMVDTVRGLLGAKLGVCSVMIVFFLFVLTNMSESFPSVFGFDSEFFILDSSISSELEFTFEFRPEEPP